jgi:biotin carboxylase
MGGDCIGSHLVHISTGYDFVGMVIDIACGKEPDFSHSKIADYAVSCFAFNAPAYIRTDLFLDGGIGCFIL